MKPEEEKTVNIDPLSREIILTIVGHFNKKISAQGSLELLKEKYTYEQVKKAHKLIGELADSGFMPKGVSDISYDMCKYCGRRNFLDENKLCKKCKYTVN